MCKYAAEQQSTQITLKGMAIAPRFLDHGEEFNRRYQEADSALTPLSPQALWCNSLLVCPVLEERGRSHQVVLHLYPPLAGTCETLIYSDAGDGYGDWRLDHFEAVRFEQGLDLIWREEGEFSFPYTSVRVQVHGFELQQVWVDDVAAKHKENEWKGDRFQKIYLQRVSDK
ncbi:MAG: hypothetical protein HC899_04395 [Leptolyngbyaceae cyanobacterium SM1_4_3]|nr:hypothetical protein [Leptolyngbyaceae cyanobacterium SM1_4_3]